MELIELGKTPINQDNPSGSDVRFEPEYDELQSEIEKLTSPTSEGGVDWNKVIKLCTTIIAEKSKHLLVASYLCVALVRSRGVDGLETGLVIYRDMLDTFWDVLFPPIQRMRGRQNAIEWWKDGIISAIKSLPPNLSLTEEKVDNLNEIVGAIGSFFDEHVDDPPSLHQLQESIAALQDEAGPETAEQQEGGILPGHEPPPPEKIIKQEESTDVIPVQNPDKVLSNGLDLLSQAATIFMKNDPSNEMSYRLTRLAAWLPVKKLPPAEDGKTRIPPPMQEIIKAMKNLYQKKEYKGLLESAEGRVGQFLFWLDLSHYVAEALEELDYEEAHSVVVQETATYVSRLPGIEELSFSDGTPFADEDTKGWLKSIAIDKSGGTKGSFVIPGKTHADSEETEIYKVYKQSEALMKKKKLEEAVELIQEKLSGGTSQQSRFLWRIVLIRLLTNAQKARLAVPHLREILDDINKHHLDNWDPDLVLSALTEVYRCLTVQTDKELQDQATEAMDRITKISPVVALRLTK
ncbi:MAG: type VI secretion system protein TssA [Deltaproteobacteria bacterium]|nr:type VI secretion system protein TssA [Deltaproteobacteria bacterium]